MIPGQTDIITALADARRKPLDRVGLACTRVRECLTVAERENTLLHGWYFHMDRRDVEVLLAHAEARNAN